LLPARNSSHWKRQKRLKAKVYKTISQAKEIQKQAGISMFITYKVDVNTKLVRRNKGHCILIKEMFISVFVSPEKKKIISNCKYM
jgi:hypothetical protein